MKIIKFDYDLDNVRSYAEKLIEECGGNFEDALALLSRSHIYLISYGFDNDCRSYIISRKNSSSVSSLVQDAIAFANSKSSDIFSDEWQSSYDIYIKEH